MEFSINRLWYLIKRDIKINLKADILKFAIVIVLFYFATIAHNPIEVLVIVFMTATCGFLGFREYEKKKNKVKILLLPVSNLERFLSAFIRIFVVTFIFFTIALMIGVSLGAVYNKIVYQSLDLNKINEQGHAFEQMLWRVNDENYISGLLVYLLKFIKTFIIKWNVLLCLFFFGSIFYKKLSGAKMGVFFFVFTMSIFYIGRIFLGINDNAFLFTRLFGDWFHFILSLMGIFLLWLSYLRLTEEQV